MVLQQKVQNPPLKSFQALLVVVGIVAVLILDSILCQLLVNVMPAGTATILFYAVGVLVALWVMRRFILSYTYAMNDTVLRIAYTYGRYERLMGDIYLSNLVACGTLADMQTRFPSARVRRAVLPKCTLDHFAIVTKSSDETLIYLLQPTPELHAALKETVRENRKG